MIHFRKILTGALASFLAAASVAFPAPVKADEFDISTIYEPYFMVSDADNPTVALDGLEKDADLRVFPASTTKVLSCIVAIEQTEQNGKSFSDMVSVSANAVDFGRGNSLMGLEEGDSYSLEDLLYGMMLPSGNDAAIAIAEHIAGSTKAFAALMNAKAQQLGMTSSHFVTVHGKHNDDHYTTVRDMAKLTAYALKNEMFCKIVSTATYTAESGPRAIELVNSNRMLIDTPPTEKLQNPISCLYENCIGVKTGDTTQAGKCLIAAARKEGITLIAILYGGTLGDSSYDAGASDSRRDPYNAYRFQDAKRLFEYEFNKMERSVTLQELKQSGLQTEFEIRVPNAIIDDPNGGILTVRADLADSMTMNLMEPKLRAILDNAATLQFYFMAPNGIEGLTVEIGGVEYTIHSTSTSGKYYVEITQMSAGDFRKVLTAKFKLNGTETGQAFSYSMNTYVSQVENHATFGSLAQRLYNYGKSAYNYVN